MLKILWKRGEIAPEEQFLLLSTLFCSLMLDCCVKTRIRFSLRDKRLFEITEVEIKRVDCTSFLKDFVFQGSKEEVIGDVSFVKKAEIYDIVIHLNSGL